RSGAGAGSIGSGARKRRRTPIEIHWAHCALDCFRILPAPLKHSRHRVLSAAKVAWHIRNVAMIRKVYYNGWRRGDERSTSLVSTPQFPAPTRGRVPIRPNAILGNGGRPTK